MIALLLAAAAAASTPAPVVIRNVRVEVGNGTVLEKATVRLAGGRIASVTPGDVASPDAIDGSGKTLAPGFISAASQLGIVEIGEEPSTIDSGTRGSPYRPGFSTAWGFNPTTVEIPNVRDEGVTSAVLAPQGGVLSGQAAWIDLTGSLSSAPDPAKPIALFAAINSDAAGQAGGARGALWLGLREAFADARFYKQNRSAYEQGHARPLSISPLHLEALLPVIDGTIPLVIAAHRASDIQDAISFAQTEHLKLIILGGAESWQVADQLSKAQVPVVIQPSGQEPASFDQMEARDDLPALLEKAHVPVLINCSDFPQSSRRLRQEAGIAIANGLSRGAAIEAITLGVARAFGRSREYGSIEAGKRADIVLWSGDPLELSSVAEHIWIDGEEQSLHSRERALAERYQKRK
jgi:imidazolonepropionase-like amidohydrolase